MRTVTGSERRRRRGFAVLRLAAPPAPFVPAELIGRPVVGIMAAAFGDFERARRAGLDRSPA